MGVSEGLFITCGKIHISKRPRLLPVNGEMPMFLNYKLRMLNYVYKEIGIHNDG